MRKIYIMGVFLLITLNLRASAQAREIRFNDITMDAGEAQKIIVTGYKGSVKLIPTKTPGKIVIHAKKLVDDKKQGDDPWIFGAKHEDKNIRIEVRGPDSRANWEDLKQLTTEIQFEIEAPNLAFDIAWRDGDITIQNWVSPLNVVLLDGTINLSHSNASVHLQSQTGEIHVTDHKGRADIETLKARVFVSDFDGNLRVKNFAGESNLEKLSATLHLQSKMGATHLTKSQGSLEIENGKGAFNILDFSGQIRGQNEDGPVTAKILGDVDASIESAGGSMSFKLPESTAAFVKLQSEDGIITAPENFKTARIGNLKVASGKFSGSEKGSLLLKSKSGNLRVH